MDVQVTVAMRVGTYGFAEVYYLNLPGTAKLADAEPKILALLDKRMPLCGGGIAVDFARISDVKVRRDADDITINGFTISNGDGKDKVDAPGTFTKVWKAIMPYRAINPTLCVLCRLEGPDAVYHAPHYLSGMPDEIFLSDSTIDPDNNWKNGVTALEKALKDGGWQFPCKSRVIADQADDRPVTAYDPATGIVTVNGAGWVVGDQIRLMYFSKPRTEPVRSFSERIKTVVANSVTFQVNPPITWSVGPKSIAHKEKTIYVPIDKFKAEHSTKHSRGRPLNSPVGRRRRR